MRLLEAAYLASLAFALALDPRTTEVPRTIALRPVQGDSLSKNLEVLKAKAI